MPKNIKSYTLFIAAPSDIKEEKTIVRKLAAEWNRLQGETQDVRVEVQDWESDSFPLYGKRPQALINEQVFDQCDFVIGIFWTRFGLPTGEAGSGTEEEILRAIQMEKPLALYFSDKPVNPSSINHGQYQKILEFRKDHKDNNLYGSYDSIDVFEENFRGDLARIMRMIIGVGQKEASSSSNPKGEEVDETGTEYEKPQVIEKLIEKNFKVYWAKLYGIVESDENVLPNGMRISKANQNKQELASLIEKVAEWEQRIEDYSTELQRVLSSMNEYSDDEFKNEIFAKNLWTVNGALTNPDRELERYRTSFEKMEAHFIVETVKRIIEVSHQYLLETPPAIKAGSITKPEDFAFAILVDPPTLLTGVIGKGIRSEILHKLHPDLFTLMTRRSIWGLYFLTNESSEFVVDDNYKGTFRTVHNWDYLYDRFSYYNFIIYKLMKKYLTKHKINLNDKFRYGYVNLFLVDIGRIHSEDINKLKKPRKI